MKLICRLETCFLWLMMTLALSGCTLDLVTARQEKASSYWPELLAGQTYGQTFTSESAHLYRLDLATVTFERQNTCTVIFHLRTDPQAAQDLETVRINCADIQNDRPTEVIFQPLADSENRSYYFFLESPDASAGNAVSLYVRDGDAYLPGSAYQNQQPAGADLTFTAYSQEDYTIPDVVTAFIQRWTEDPLFSVVYLLLLGLVTGVWIWTAVGHGQPTPKKQARK